MKIYHYTDSARLPWIIKSGELRPGVFKAKGMPDDFLWATESEQGDKTASYAYSPNFLDLYRRNRCLIVRITLRQEGFSRWRQLAESTNGWHSDFIATIERSAEGRADPSKWWCRNNPVPVSAFLALEAKTYGDNRWRPVDPSIQEIQDSAGVWSMVKFGSKLYGSIRDGDIDGAPAYTPGFI